MPCYTETTDLHSRATWLARENVRRATVPERKWHYLTRDEIGEEEETDLSSGLARVRSRPAGEHHDSVISRIRRMKLQQRLKWQLLMKCCPCRRISRKHQEQEERRIARSFISSRHHSWYDTVPINYKKVPSQCHGKAVPVTHPPVFKDNRRGKGKVQANSRDQQRLWWKSVLNVDLPETEAEILLKGRRSTRWRRTGGGQLLHLGGRITK
ncbi:uncharacterized protein CEXT_776201 [Caerostris extrusa]|uniref:Uncharacterized protein n=1 Tax=Caerostris extrusa TaxID=172846 RepID=A0AAV4MZ94_CAEEX|nr:uncharacterized protein CEXT_776201 [Caerostris extrusa]